MTLKKRLLKEVRSGQSSILALTKRRSEYQTEKAKKALIDLIIEGSVIADGKWRIKPQTVRN